MNKDHRVHELEKELARVSSTLATLIIWITQAAGSPLSVENAQDLLKRLEGKSR